MDEALLKQAQDKVDYEAAHDPSVKKTLGIVEAFLKANRVLCYGGTAINNLLPPEDQFYDPEYDIPDYDFYSKEPQIHALRLVDIFSRAGYKSVEAKPGVHLMTYKVFVDFMGVADITYLDPKVFDKLWGQTIVRDEIHYVSPNFLRMSMYLELSRPRGDVSRWKKVYERLMLLNRHYPVGCSVDDEGTPSSLTDGERKRFEKLLHGKDIVLLGAQAVALHSKSRKNVWNVPVDLLTTDVEGNLEAISNVFRSKEIKVVMRPAYAELLPAHADMIETESGFLLARIFQTSACHSYHDVRSGLKVASIPTLLQFFFGFVYADAHFLEGYDENRIVCICQRLVDMAHAKGKRKFEMLTPLECLGKQSTLQDIKKQTSDLKESISKTSSDFLKFFFTYKPGTLNKTQKQKVRTTLRKTLRNGVPADGDIVADRTTD